MKERIEEELNKLEQLEEAMMHKFADYVTLEEDKVSNCNRAYYAFRDQLRVVRKLAEEHKSKEVEPQ